MNYTKSQEIIEEIDKAKRILVNLHRGPDPDSFACAMSLYYFLCSLNKDTDVVLTSHSALPSELKMFKDADIIKNVDYTRFNFKNYDLFITSDSGSWQQIVDDPKIKIPP